MSLEILKEIQFARYAEKERVRLLPEDLTILNRSVLERLPHRKPMVLQLAEIRAYRPFQVVRRNRP